MNYAYSTSRNYQHSPLLVDMIHSEREKSMRSSESRVEEWFNNVHSEALAIESSEARVKFIAYIDDGKRDTSLHIMPCVQSYAVQYFDAYMQQLPLPTATKSNASTLPTVDFRLLGQAALFISSKVHTSGLDYMDLDDVIDIDRNYSRNDVIEMEKHLLSSIGYKLFPSIPQVTASLFLQQIAATSTIKDHVLIQVEELLHHAMCTPTMLSAHNSFSIGAAAVLVALKDTFENHLQEQHYYNQEKSILICRNAFLEYESIYERTRRKEQRDTVRKDPSRKRRRQLGSIRLEDEVKAALMAIDVKVASVTSIYTYLQETGTKVYSNIFIRDMLLEKSDKFKQIRTKQGKLGWAIIRRGRKKKKKTTRKDD